MKRNFFQKLGDAAQAFSNNPNASSDNPTVSAATEHIPKNTEEIELINTEIQPTSFYSDGSTESGYTRIGTISYTGEKSEGEAGPVINYRINHEILTMRSWAAYLDSELAQTVVGKYETWLIGDGLDQKSIPPQDILAEEGITLDSETFARSVESRFRLFKKSRTSDHAGMDNLDILARRAKVHSIVGGDVLLILRVDENFNVNIELKDGVHVRNPFSYEYNYKLENGNTLCHGIEKNSRGQHVRYHVRNKDNSFTTIEARSDDGLIMSRMIYGLKYRLDNDRGLPLLAACLETIKQMDRYKGAMLGNAEEIAKTVFQIIHQEFSTGANPMMDKMLSQSGFNVGTNEAKVDAANKVIANKFKATFNKEAYNMPRGSKLEPIQNKNTLYFGEFFNTNINLVCATIQIPPDVAMSSYNANFSASRAALKDWENTLNVGRGDFGFQFYQTVYEFWLHVQILKNKIKAPGYLAAHATGNIDVTESYRKTRWYGAQVPHIDPVKEVKAEIMKLGKAAEFMPLTTGERATEVLNGGDFKENVKQFKTEYQDVKELMPAAPAPEKKDNGKTTRKTEKKD